MKKTILLILLASCQYLVFGNTITKNSMYVDSSVENLSLANQNVSSKSFHLFSHGKPGELFIGNHWMNAEEIAKNFKSQLKGKKELYIYGCNFAEGQKGSEAVKYLEKNLNLAVSASTNVTGKDGDWILEVGKGKNALALTDYRYNLQLGKMHYLNPIVAPKYNQGRTIDEEFIYLSTPSATDITVQMNFPIGTGSPYVVVQDLDNLVTPPAPYYVSNGTLTLKNSRPIRIGFVNADKSVKLPGVTPTTIAMTLAGTVIPGTGEGLIFSSTSDFYVNYRARCSIQAGTVLTKGNAALGKEFRWGGTPIEKTTTISEIGNMLSVMATVDNTSVTISDIKPGTEFFNGSNPTPLVGPSITRTLNKGESFILYAAVKLNTSSAQDDGWLGAKVSATKDVTVVVGGLLQQGDIGDNRDIGLDQLVAVPYIGSEYIVMKGNGGTAEKAVVVTTAPNTKIYLNGNATPVTTLAAAGSYFLVNSPYFTPNVNNVFIRTDKPVYVFQKIFGGAMTNTNNLLFIPPLSCVGENIVDLIPDANRIGTTSYSSTELVVLATAANAPTATLGGVVLVPTVNGGTVNGNTDWLTYRYLIGNSNGSIKVSSAGPIQAQLFGASGAAGFGGYYSGFGQTASVTITSDLPFPCAGVSTLTAPAGLASYQWYKDGTAIVGATSNTYTLNPVTDAAPASYYVFVKFAGGCSAFSNTLESKLCPCTKPGSTATPTVFTKLGISTRDKRTTANWPKDIPNGFLTMESNTKGFVITRMASPETAIANPVAGMLVYDTDEPCLKLYDGTTWKCIAQTCNQ